MVDDEKALTPWLMDLAELYVQRGMAIEKAVPESRAALMRHTTAGEAGQLVPDGSPGEINPVS